uniref:Ras-associating domain-containing protein n=1 Tax=Rhabditophanes sp. KR3021 TaxID=114890 RepID=A0AC35U4R3_9BILA
MASQKSYEKIETVEQVVNSDSVEKIKIRIKLNLKRPINVVEKNETIQLGTGSPSLPIGTITSMYVPKNTSKLISVKGDVKSSRLITYLLTKLKVADNPRKFALYYHLKEDDERLKKVNDDELPCNLFELMKPIDDGLFEFVLQENDDSEISWVSFEVPELENFLKILEVQEVNHRQRLIEEKRALAFYLDIEIRDRERKKTLDII